MKFKLKNAVSTVVPTVGGAIAAKLLKNVSGKMVKNEKIRAALPLIVGIFLTQSKKTEKLGLGMVAVGGADLAGTLVPALSGIEDMDLSGVLDGFDDIHGADEMYGPLDGFEDIHGPLNGDDYMSEDIAGSGDDYGNY